MASPETMTQIAIAALGSGFTGAVAWWINRKWEKSKGATEERAAADLARKATYEADVQARKDVYAAFGGIIDDLRSSNTQLWAALNTERERASAQDLALLECEQNSARHEENSARLENMVQHLKGRVSVLEQLLSDSGSVELDSDYDYKRLHGLTPRDSGEDE